MPNWCFNHLTVTGPAEDVARFQEQAAGFRPWHSPEAGQAPDLLNFHSLLPIPAEVLTAGYAPAGYNWERHHWGCKWGACHAALVDKWEGGVFYEFDTAWSPPLPLVQHVSRVWPTLVFVLDYEDPRMGFKGVSRAEGGVLEGHCINL